MNKKHKFLIFSILISILFLYLAVRKIDIDEVRMSLRMARYPYLIAGSLFMVLSFLIRGLRWKLILSPIKNCKFLSVFSVLVIGFMANNLLPFRVGEFARAYLNGKKEEISKSSSLATIGVERIFDGLSILIILFAISFILSFPHWATHLTLVATLLFVGALIFVYTLTIKESFSVNLLKKIMKIMPEGIRIKVSRLLDSFVLGLKIFHRIDQMILLLLISVVIWLCDAFIFYSVSLALRLNMGYVGALFTLVIVALGIMIPSSPGYIGVYEYFTILSLSLFSIAKSEALTYAVLVHFVQFTVIFIGGMWFLAKENVSLMDLKKFENKEGTVSG